LAVAEAGANVILHYGRSAEEAQQTQEELRAKGVQAHAIQADLSDPQQASELCGRAGEFGPLYALVNNAAIFQSLTLADTDIEAWNEHLAINLTAPFLLCQAFAQQVEQGRIVNILDWRALRPKADHLPYTISKAGLVALTRSLAVELAPRITVNGIAFGAILPPSDGGDTSGVIANVPAGRWAELKEAGETLLFFLEGPDYITGEILHLDGGRHLV